MSYAQAIRDIVVTSINKGQLPVLGLIAIILLLIYKLPEQNASDLLFEVLHSIQDGRLIGYFLFVASTIGWYLHVRSMRKQFSEEAKRIGQEKSDIQSKAAGTHFQSSNDK